MPEVHFLLVLVLWKYQDALIRFMADFQINLFSIMLSKFMSKSLIKLAKAYRFLKSENPYTGSVFMIGMLVAMIIGFVLFFLLLILNSFRKPSDIEFVLITAIILISWIYFDIKNNTKKRILFHYRNSIK